MKQQLRKGSTTDSLLLRLYDHSRLLVPSSATVEIRDAGGSSLVASGTAASVATDGTMSYVPGRAVTADYEESLLVEWNVTIGGVVKTVVETFDVVNWPLHGGYSLITDEDLISECPRLQSERYLHYGTAGSGSSSTTIVDQALKEYDDNHWKGGTVEVVGGTNDGDVRTVSAFVRDTGTLTVASAFTATADTTTLYVVRRTYQREIDRAWDDIQAWILQRGYRPALVLNSDELKPVLIYVTLEKVCRNLAGDSGDVWWDRADHYEKAGAARWQNLTFEYDELEDETINAQKIVRVGLRR